jgi:5-methylcytosine-specific restriction endonuclease McrA
MKSLQLRRLRLNPAAYRQICAQVLERDGWRCQHCGNSQNLQVHHIRFRSQLGDDTAENLVTLCANCHEQIHRCAQDRDRAEAEFPIVKD